jgi:hypothetical protein
MGKTPASGAEDVAMAAAWRKGTSRDYRLDGWFASDQQKGPHAAGLSGEPKPGYLSFVSL